MPLASEWEASLDVQCRRFELSAGLASSTGWSQSMYVDQASSRRNVNVSLDGLLIPVEWNSTLQWITPNYALKQTRGNHNIDTLALGNGKPFYGIPRNEPTEIRKHHVFVNWILVHGISLRSDNFNF